MKFFLLLVFGFSLLCLKPAAQTCNLNVNAGQDTVLCAPGSVQLNGSTGAAPALINSISWQPVSGLSNPNLLNPVLNATTGGQYILTVNAVTGNNLVFNGDFSLGDTGFTTTYVQGTGGLYGILSNEGEFDISTDPSLSHDAFDSFGDHTTGSGNMMVINGADFPTPIWCQTVAVLPNTMYDFSAWMVTCYPTNPGILQFSINGSLLGSPFSLSSATGVWEHFAEPWFSGSDTIAEICIMNQSTAIGGNDFAIDDIFLSEVCIQSDTVNIIMANAGALNIGNDTMLCPGNALTLNASLPAATSYLWNTGDQSAFLTISQPDTYSVVVTIDSSCTISDTIIASALALDLFPQNDTVVCPGQPVMLSVSAPAGSNIQWNTGQTGSSINTDTSGIYIVSVAFGNCMVSDSIQVTAPLLNALPEDTVKCVGQNVLLSAFVQGAQNYLWNTGDTASTLSVVSPGLYFVTVTVNSTCVINDSTMVSETSIVSLGPDITSCNPAILNAEMPGALGYLWNTGETSPEITISSTGSYIVSVQFPGCILSDTIDVIINPVSANIDTSVVYFNPGDVIQVNATGSGLQPFSWNWFPDTNISCIQCPDPMLTLFDDTFYVVTLTDANGCMDTDTVWLLRNPCDSRIFFPNAFTPNSDGINDYYYAPAFCPGPFEFHIFNRWGDLIYTSTDPSFTWNGKRNGNGKDSPEGTYFYLCNMGDKSFRGAITLIR